MELLFVLIFCMECIVQILLRQIVVCTVSNKWTKQSFVALAKKTFLFFRELRKRQPTVFLLNICFNLLVANIIFVFGSGNIASFGRCYFSAALMHFFLLVTWFWMSGNAYNMYIAFTDVSFEYSFHFISLLGYK